MDELWKVDRAPRIGALRRAASRSRALPAGAAALRIDPSCDPTHSDVLLSASVAARLVWHPSTAALLEAAGATTDDTNGYVLPVTGPRADPAAVADLARRILPAAWVTTSPGNAAAAVPTEQLAELLSVDLEDSPKPAGKHAGGHIRITRKGRNVTLRLLAEPVALPGNLGNLTAARSTRMRPTQVPDVLDVLRKAGWVVLDADTGQRFADLGWVHDRRLLLRPAAHAPGWVAVEHGALVTSAVTDLMRAPDAVAAAGPAAGKVALAVDPVVAAVARGSRAGAVPSAVPEVTLRPWQEQFIGQYLGNGRGLVNALPPGAGKTACVAGAMAVAAATDPTHQGLVVVPTTLLEQWVGELGRFHPRAKVLTATSEADLPAVTALSAQSAGPSVVVTSPTLVAKHPRVFAALAVHDLAVDEATYLRGQSAQSAALWQVRHQARRAAVLTGTPETGSNGSVEALVSFAAATPDLMTHDTTGMDTRLSALSALERAGAWVFGQGADLAGALPGADANSIDIPTTVFEDAVTRAAASHVRALLDKATTPTQMRKAATVLRTVLDGWRTGLASPAALMSGRSALGRAVRDDLVSTGALPSALSSDTAPVVTWQQLRTAAGAKVTWAGQWVADSTDPSLVFADSVPALELLADHLEGRGVADVAVLSGKVRPPARARLVDRFTAGDLRVLLIASTGQLGLNLQTASRVAHLDVPASAASLTQRSARAARMGATHTSIDVAVPLLARSAETTWWSHAAGAAAPTDILGLARELLSAAS